jgi:voltage-gated potassium channel
MRDINANDKREPEFPDQEELDRERYELLQQLANWLETPMLILAFVWLALLVAELIWGESPAFEIIGAIIWIIFILNFVVEFVLAPRKVVYLKGNWLTAISLLVPALRIFRIFRMVRLLRLTRVGRGLRLFRVISSLNRGMRALAANLQRRGFGYVIALTILVIFAGAAGMYTFENETSGGMNSYGEALWWTAMIMTTMGSQYWPQTFEGRMLCFFLALYAFAVFGYVTATLATFFVGRDAENSEAELAGTDELTTLRKELSALRDDIRALSQQPPEA